MTMDKSAIQQLQQADAIAKANTALPESVAGVVMLPDNFSKHDLESIMPNRRNYRGKFSTTIIGEFAEYVTGNKQEGMTCFVDPDSMSAETIFDLLADGKPGHGEHRATVTLQKNPEYSELLSINGDALSQKNMAEFIEDHIDFLTFYDANDDEMNRSKVVSAIRKINIEEARKLSSEVGDFHAERSALETVKANADGGLPSSVVYTCIPYEGLGEYQFSCRLAISEGSNSINLRLTVRSLDRLKAEMADEFSDNISVDLPSDDMKIYRGKYKY